ncbi:MAG: MarR family transcriptional regulator [Candidatus Marinimicrobia bacterium]|nr:MarR family transcriptional regulator [Candidatus Neomarinimicrobiota bacterium]
MDLSEQIRDLNSQLTAIIRQIAARHQLTYSQANILLTIPVEGILMSHLAEKIGIDVSTATRNLMKLESLGLIIRSKIHKDRRKVTVTATTAGEALIDKLEIDLDEVSFSIQKMMTNEDREKFFPVLESLNWNLTKLRADN